MAAENPAFACFIELEKPEVDFLLGPDYRTFPLNHADELPNVDKPPIPPLSLIMVEQDPILHKEYIRTISKKDFVALETTSIFEGTLSRPRIRMR
ncbi:hypothetical protein BGZ82_008115 [Podila clonocystis]|nr:hypothetical protein BGZ82_008115 [Podila clonocystis]